MMASLNEKEFFIMKKKLASLMLAAMLSVSVTACQKNDSGNSSNASQTASDASVAEKKDEAPAVDYEVNEQVKKAIDDNIPEDKLGKKTKYNLDKLAAKEFSINFSLKIDSEKNEDSQTSETASTNPLAGKEIKISFSKNNDNNIRTDLDLAGITLDILVNKDGTYFLDSSSKTAVKTKTGGASVTSDTAEDSAKASSDAAQETPESSSEQGSSSPLGGMSLDSLKDSFKSNNGKFEYTGDGEAEFNGQKYSYEGYSFSMKGLPSLAGTAGIDSSDKNDNNDNKDKETTADIKCFYDDYDLIGFSLVSGKNAINITINKFETKADSKLFEVPSDYKVKEDDGSYLGSLLGMFSALGGNTGINMGGLDASALDADDEPIITAD